MTSMDEIEKKFIQNGKLITIPRKMTTKRLVLEWFRQKLLDEGDSFTERELNEIIKRYYADFAIIRRYLVDYKLISRDSAGMQYTVELKEK